MEKGEKSGCCRTDFVLPKPTSDRTVAVILMEKIEKKYRKNSIVNKS